MFPWASPANIIKAEPQMLPLAALQHQELCDTASSLENTHLGNRLHPWAAHSVTVKLAVHGCPLLVIAHCRMSSSYQRVLIIIALCHCKTSQESP